MSPAGVAGSEPSVVVLGGGYGGIRVATGLEEVASVTLVDPTEAFVHNVAAWRALVDPAWLERIIFPYERLLSTGAFMRDRAVDADGRGVTLASGARLEPDILVLATGSSYAFPAKCEAQRVEDVLDQYRSAQAALHAAEHVLILGAGPSGLELAGEIRAGLEGKRVTLIDPAPDLLDGPYDPRLREELRRQLLDLGVDLCLGTTLRALPATPAGGAAPVTVVTTDGSEISADVWYQCFGVRLASDYLSGSLAVARGAGGSVAVNQFLQVRGHDRVFALGDVASADRKMAGFANRQAAVVVANVRSMLAGEGSLQSYSRFPPAIVVPLGPNGGSGQMPGQQDMLSPAAAAQIKGRDMMIDDYVNLFTAPA